VYCILLWRCITKLDISFLTGNLFMLLELSTVGGNSWIFMTVYMSIGLFVLSLDWKMQGLLNGYHLSPVFVVFLGCFNSQYHSFFSMGKDVPFSHMLSFYHRTHMISYLNFETLQFNFLNIIISFIVDVRYLELPSPERCY
jgi:hypothetical protein